METSTNPFSGGLFALTTAQILACKEASVAHSITEQEAANLTDSARHIVVHAQPSTDNTWNVTIALVIDFKRESEDGRTVSGSSIVPCWINMPETELNLVYRGTLYEPKELKVKK